MAATSATSTSSTKGVPDQANRSAPQENVPSTASKSQFNLLDYLPTTLTVLTGTLGAVGGLTGGIARMFRNEQGLATVILVLAVLSIFLAFASQATRPDKLAIPTTPWQRFVKFIRLSVVLLVLAITCSLFSLVGGVSLAVQVASLADRPSLGAEFVQLSDGQWAIEGEASSSGLEAESSMVVYLYAIRSNGKSNQMYLARAGPNADGVASQSFSLPLPKKGSYTAVVATANIGNLPRLCDGTALRRSGDPRSVRRALDPDAAVEHSCVSLTFPR